MPISDSFKFPMRLTFYAYYRSRLVPLRSVLGLEVITDQCADLPTNYVALQDIDDEIMTEPLQELSYR